MHTIQSLSILLICFVLETFTMKLQCHECTPVDFTRIKRAKYHSGPPRYYKRPPTAYPSHGAFSYTPPPGYMTDDEDRLPSRSTRLHKKPTHGGLRDEDINNLFKYLTKKDLDKIVEFASEKDQYKERDTPYEKTVNDYSKLDYSTSEDNYQETNVGKKNSLDNAHINPSEIFKQPNKEYDRPSVSYSFDAKPPNEIEDDVPDTSGNSEIYSNPFLETEKSMRNEQFATIDGYIQQELHQGNKESNIFTDSKIMNEEQLPAPVNLRQDDYEVSYTNNVPTVVKSDSSSYQIENFGSLPLMNYNSKLHTVSSYNVPHYTVTTPFKYQQPPNQQTPSKSAMSHPQVEPAPSVANYKDQSDAHLKATKIWTHKSRGTAYTLHRDGTLSLERPIQSKPKYG